MMELVDFNTIYGKEAEVATAKKRTRRGAKKSDDAAVEAATEVIEATEVEAEAKPKKTRKKKDDSAE
jgi:large subunit ribosomal protein L17